jgi:hypothetical protein
MPSNGTPIMSIRVPLAVFSAVAGGPIACSQPSRHYSKYLARRHVRPYQAAPAFCRRAVGFSRADLAPAAPGRP